MRVEYDKNVKYVYCDCCNNRSDNIAKIVDRALCPDCLSNYNDFIWDLFIRNRIDVNNGQ